MRKDADFIYPDLLPDKPYISTETTPHAIVGPFGDLIKKHYELYTKYTDEESRHKAMERAGIDEGKRARAAEIYKLLKENGFYVVGLDEHKRIKLGIVTTKHESEIEYSQEEIKKAKLTFKTMAKGVIRGFGSIPKVTKADIEYERDKF